MILESEVATFVVLRGESADEVAAAAKERISLDRARRRLIVPGDDAYPSSTQIRAWVAAHPGAAAVILTPSGAVSDVFDKSRATSAAWIEDAFVRALRPDYT